MAKSFDELVKRTATRATQRRGALRSRELLTELLLSEVRRFAGMSQSELADALGIRQPSISKLERQNDMLVSTLRQIVDALGGEIHILARFPARTIRVSQFDRPQRRKSRAVVREISLG